MVNESGGRWIEGGKNRERKEKTLKYSMHKSKPMFNNQIKSLAENCSDTLLQMASEFSLLFFHSFAYIGFGHCFDQSSIGRSYFEANGSSWNRQQLEMNQFNSVAMRTIVQDGCEESRWPETHSVLSAMSRTISFACVRIYFSHSPPPPTLCAQGWQSKYGFFWKSLRARIYICIFHFIVGVYAFLSPLF